MVSAATSGLSRSGSGNTMSNAITTAPSLVRLAMRSAIRVRGHGHWPSFARLFSSISIMVTGLAVFTRGSMSWKVSKVLTRSSSTGEDRRSRRAASPIRSTRHTSLAYPNRRANHLRNTLSRFMRFQTSCSIGLVRKLRIETPWRVPVNCQAAPAREIRRMQRRSEWNSKLDAVARDGRGNSITASGREAHR